MFNFRLRKWLTVISAKQNVIEVVIRDEWKVDEAFDIPLNLIYIVLKNEEKIGKGNFPHVQACLVKCEEQGG